MKLDIESELAIANAATAGPWFQWTACGDVSSEPEDCAVFFSCLTERLPDGSSEHTKQGEADCVFLVHARTNYPIALQTLLAIKELCESEGGELAGRVLGLINQGEK